VSHLWRPWVSRPHRPQHQDAAAALPQLRLEVADHRGRRDHPAV